MQVIYKRLYKYKSTGSLVGETSFFYVNRQYQSRAVTRTCVSMSALKKVTWMTIKLGSSLIDGQNY